MRGQGGGNVTKQNLNQRQVQEKSAPKSYVADKDTDVAENTDDKHTTPKSRYEESTLSAADSAPAFASPGSQPSIAICSRSQAARARAPGVLPFAVWFAPSRSAMRSDTEPKPAPPLLCVLWITYCITHSTHCAPYSAQQPLSAPYSLPTLFILSPPYYCSDGPKSFQPATVLATPRDW